jgi:NADH:ubiquinone oxidoreductase subunit E
MIEIGIIGGLLLAIVLGNSDVNHKEDTETMLCVGVCLSTEAAVMDGNTHDEHDPSMTKILEKAVSN